MDWLEQALSSFSRGNLANKNAQRQISTLVYCLGCERTEDILFSFDLTEEEAASFDTVLDKFYNHFVVRTIVIFEWAQFNLTVDRSPEKPLVTSLLLIQASGNVQLR